MDFEKLKDLNSHLNLHLVTDESFRHFGKVIEGYDWSDISAYADKHTIIPDQGNLYVASDLEMGKLKIKDQLQNRFYGEMPIQIGYCNGVNSTLNGLEYHKGSEINVAFTDFVLLLGSLQDVIHNTFDVAKVMAFFVPKGTAIQIYETTLHFAPCKTQIEGFKCLVVLPKGTNTPLLYDKRGDGDALLFARNKWLIAHPQRKNLIDKGAFPGIIGRNLEVKYK